MRKLFLSFIPLLLCVLFSNAQYKATNDNEAMQLVGANKASLHLSDADLTNVVVSRAYTDNASGITMVYLQQTYQSIPVYNQMLVLAFKNNKLVSNAGEFNHGIEKQVNIKTGTPSITPEAAVQSALSDRKLVASQMAIAISRKEDGRKIEFNNMGVSRENITAQLMWVPILETKGNSTSVSNIKLMWQVYIIPKTTPDYWLVKVDALDNSILGMDNLTVYDNWGPSPDAKEKAGKSSESTFTDNNLFDFKTVNKLATENPASPSIVNSATYRVIPFPAESPQIPVLGTPATRTNPWTNAPGNATTLNWHTGAASTNYVYTRGNNVWAYQDQANNNTGTQAKSATSTTSPDPLTFDFVPNFTVAPTQSTPVENQQFNITNLFYWNNIIHDVMYIYGFTEASANFQDDNLGRGGNGNDHVNAEAQDGGGTNNANFSTPADGASGRMQMYLWNIGGSNPNKDGDVDNGIVVHEAGHGISNRLTGGGIATCLGNAEQMGEGWSDFYGMMFTQDWATSTLTTGFTTPRGLGLYALNNTNLFPGSPPLTGIRHFPYCTNFAVNGQVYLAVLPTAPHDRGEIWAATLWDMTWNIINQVGTINPNLYDLAGGGGNTIALKLVTEGLKLQQCGPGFISGRNAILQADQNLYGGAYSCAIWEAFRRRGMGAFASEGSSNSVTDQVPDYTPPITFNATVSAATIPEGQNLTYTNTVTTCSAITGYTLRDTLPLNVTYVSGGTYDAATRIVSFNVTQAAGTSNYVFVVNVNPGSYFAPVTLLNEPVAGAGIPAGWAATSAVGPSNWVSSSAQSHSAPNSLFGVDNIAAVTDFSVANTTPVALGAVSGVLTFWHNYDTEPTWDGGVVEISTNGGTTWTDLGNDMLINGYNNRFDPQAANTNPLRGRPAFTGTSSGWIQTTVDLVPYANQNALIRFRMSSDDNTGNVGWFVDDILINRIAQVNMHSGLYNASNVRVFNKKMFTPITPLILCAPSITQDPVSTTVCAASPASFTCIGSATGGVTYQWQYSATGAGGPWIVIPGATASTYTFTAALSQNGYLFRCVVTGSCPPNATSAAATLTVAAATVGGTLSPANIPVCGTPNGGTITLSGHNGSIIRWESSINGGLSWTNIANISTTLTFTNVATTTQYRALIQVTGCTAVYSSIATVVFTATTPLTILSDVGTTICAGDPALLTVVGLTSTSFSNTTPVLVPGTGTSGIAAPYPSNITVTGLPTTGVTVKSVTLNNISHTWASDMSFVLQSPAPGNQNVILMSAVAGNNGISNVTYTFDDAAATGLGVASPSGTYKPTSNSTTRNWPAPGPGTLSQPTNPLLSTFTGDLNGTWKLYAIDAVGGDAGSVAGGYSITFNAIAPVPGLTYSWTPSTGLNANNTNPVAASPAVTTTYTVFANNGAGCIRQASITLNVNARPAVTTQPTNVTVCSGLPATFTVGATGAGITYQWQESTNAGVTYTSLANGAPYAGVTTATLTINPTAGTMNNNRYRCVISGICTPNAISNGAVLTVVALPAVTVTPSTGCGGVAGTNGLLLTASGATTYVWSPIAGLFTDPNATIPYTGTNTATVYAAPTVFTVYTVSGTNATTGCVGTATAFINYTPPAPTVTPASVLMCLGDAPVKLKSSSSVSTVVTYTSGPVNLLVPDNTAAGITSTITVPAPPAGATITAMAVRLNMSHTYPGDMIFNLKAPNNQILNLYKYAGGSFTGLNSGVPTWGWYNASVSSAGTAAFNSIAVAPFTYNASPIWIPDALNTTVAGVTIQNPTGFVSAAANFPALYSLPNGTWTLAMADGGLGDVGTLASWSLDITYTTGVPATPAVWSPIAGLFSNPAGTVPYIAGTAVDSVWAAPTPSGVYPYQATVQSVPLPPASITTTFANNNQFSLVTSNFKNNNSYPVTITGIESVAATAGASTARLYYKTSAITGAPGAISAANGWILAGTSTYTAIANTTTTTSQPMLSGASVVVPAGATYGIAFESQNTGGAGNLRYSTVAAGTFINSAGGCDLISGTNVSFAGDLAPIAPTFTPRAFIGKVLFSAASTAPCTSPARTVIVTVNQPIAFTAQPADVAVCTDKVASFTAVATGTAINHNWRVSTTNGNTWIDVVNGGVYAGAKTATLTITAPPVSMSGYLYKDSVSTTPCAPKSSNVARLTVNPLPTIVISASPYQRLFPGLKTTLFSTVTPAAQTYTWLKNGVVVPNATASSLLLDVDGLGTYTLRVTDVNGCTNISNQVSITDSISGKVFIYPTPNSGTFQVRYYSIINNTNLPRGLNIYDARGKRVEVKTYSINAPYQRMDVDMRRYGSGVYWVEVVDVAGNRLAIGRTEVLR